jgi:elongator complex protein 3
MKVPKKNQIRKPSKTLAGVTPIAVMLKPQPCKHGACLYCPSLNVPQSYTPLSPAAIRARMLNYSAFEQVRARLKAFSLMNHPTDKIELIVMGGTFLHYTQKYQEEFIKQCYDALNQRKSGNLEQAKKLNEKSKNRAVALCIETRPDTCSEKNIKNILKLGATRVELGVQCLDNKIYRKINRGHTVKDVINATKKLRNSGFKIGYHIMPGLPGSDPRKDLKMFSELFGNPDFQPDQIKIYPCQVIKGSNLEFLWEKNKYKPYTKTQIQKILIKMMKIVPEYCRVMRIMREIPPSYLSAGTKRIDLRYDIESELKKSKTEIKEIRFREIGFNLRDKHKNQKIPTKLKLKISRYKAGKGDEYFLQYVNKDNILFGLLRLRIFKDTQNEAIIREVHVYGKALSIGKKAKSDEIQHSGLGKSLVLKAEEIAKKQNAGKMRVISGVGAREYYKKLGYTLDSDKIYMQKKL